nr:MAG TPA: hypothetical protein [Caudoviricetes sp.]
MVFNKLKIIFKKIEKKCLKSLSVSKKVVPLHSEN